MIRERTAKRERKLETITRQGKQDSIRGKTVARNEGEKLGSTYFGSQPLNGNTGGELETSWAGFRRKGGSKSQGEPWQAGMMAHTAQPEKMWMFL